MAQEGANGAATAGIVGFKPQLVVPAAKAEAAVQFYKTAFGAEELRRVMHPKRKADHELPLILSVEIKIGSSSLLISDPFDDAGAEVAAVGSGGIAFRLEAEDVDAAVKKAMGAGAELVREITEDEAGGIVGKVKDPFGVVWGIASVGKKSAEADA